MKQKNYTKRALCMSLLSMLLCCSMLIGTTFAWFTDSVTSGKNKIVAGNLDVELYHSNANVSDEEITETTENLFVDKDGNPIKWEPGMAVYETFTVKNEGSLALKYELALTTDKDGTNSVMNKDGTDTNKTLADVLKIAVLEGNVADGTTRDDLVAMLTGAVTLKDYVSAETVSSGKLVPAGKTVPVGEDGWKVGEESFTVILYWEPGTDDDDYNLKNGAYASDVTDESKRPGALTIDFTVGVEAAQVDYENDSFDDQYDSEATMKKIAQKKADDEAYAAGNTFRIGEGESAVYHGKGKYDSILEFLIPDGTPGVLTGDYNLPSSGTNGYKGIEGTGVDNGIYCVDLNGYTATANWIFMKPEREGGSGYDFELRNGVMQTPLSHYCDVDVYGAKTVLLKDLILGTYKNGDWQDKDDNYADAGKDTWGPSGNYGSYPNQKNGYCSPIKIFMNETAEGTIKIINVETHGGANRIKAYDSTTLIEDCVFTGSVGPVYNNRGYKNADPEALYITGIGGSHEVTIKNTTVTNKQVRLENAGVVTITGSELLAGLNVEGNTTVTLTDCKLTNETNTTGRLSQYKDINVTGDGHVIIVSGTYSFDPEHTSGVRLASGSESVKTGDVWVVTVNS